jgi:hypothetical protein
MSLNKVNKKNKRLSKKLMKLAGFTIIIDERKIEKYFPLSIRGVPTGGSGYYQYIDKGCQKKIRCSKCFLNGSSNCGDKQWEIAKKKNISLTDFWDMKIIL